MFIELTKRNSNAKFFVNTDHLEVVIDEDGCQVGLSGHDRYIKVIESYAEVVSMLGSSIEEAAPDMIKALELVEEYLDGIADADQPSGCEHPIANEEMRLLVMVRAALAKARQ